MSAAIRRHAWPLVALLVAGVFMVTESEGCDIDRLIDPRVVQAP